MSSDVPQTSQIRLSPKQRAALGAAESLSWWSHTSATRQSLIRRGLVEMIPVQDADGTRRRKITTLGMASL